MKSRQRRSFSAEMKAHPLSDAANWYYVILAPPGATVGSPGECGYHSSSTLNVSGTSIDLAWGLVFFPTPTAGEPNVNVVNSVCYCLVHEMVEAFTNPRGAGWSVNVPASGGNVGQNCEIGDLCETKAFHNVGRWNVETYWSNQDQGCVGTFGPDWTSLGAPSAGVLGAPVVGHNTNGCMECFVVGKDGSLWSSSQSAPDGSFGAWQRVVTANPVVSAPPRVGYNHDGRIEVYGMQSGGVLWHVWQTAPSGGGTLGTPTGGTIGGVTVINNQEGPIEIFGVGSDHQLHHVWQTSPNNGWSGWASLGGPAVQIAMAHHSSATTPMAESMSSSPAPMVGSITSGRQRPAMAGAGGVSCWPRCLASSSMGWAALRTTTTVASSCSSSARTALCGRLPRAVQAMVGERCVFSTVRLPEAR